MSRLTKRNADGSVGIAQCRYYNYEDFQRLAQKLADYEDKQEQGLLIELPCPVGTTIYIANPWWHCVDIGNICGIAECDDVSCFCFRVYVDPDTYTVVAILDFRKEWFLTESEAEEALERMEKE